MSFERITTVTDPAVEYQVGLLADNLRRQQYSGYPAPEDRLTLDPAQLQTDDQGRIDLPDGPWTVDAHPMQPRVELSPTPEDQARLVEQGYVLDSRGRPLHPWFLRMIADPLIGVVLGKGANWYYGPMPTVDAWAVKKVQGVDRYVRITRGDTGESAAPGGYVNPGEAPWAAARRELFEETGLVVPEDAPYTVFYQGPVADIRATAHSWQDTTAFLIRLPDGDELPMVQGNDDALSAEWVTLEEMMSDDTVFFGSHRYMAGLIAQQAERQ